MTTAMSLVPLLYPQGVQRDGDENQGQGRWGVAAEEAGVASQTRAQGASHARLRGLDLIF